MALTNAFVVPTATPAAKSSAFLAKVSPAARCVRTRPARRARSRVIVSQYNYNIYQDGAERAKRGISDGERAVTIQKPLGLVLEEAQDGMVFIAEMDPEGNAANLDEGEVFVGDVVVACSATFGDEVWSTRGIGLDRVMKSIRVRSGDFVTLVLETPNEIAASKAGAVAGASARRDAAREEFGEREVLDPTSWTSSAPKSMYDDQVPESGPEIDAQLKDKLKAEIVAPYEQNWILWASVGVGLLVIVSVVILGS